MSKPRELWWSYVKNVIRRYPYYQAELKRIKSMPVTTRFDANAVGNKRVYRKTESIALRELPPKDQRHYDAVDKAIRKTKHMRDGNLRCRLIELTYFTGKYNMQGAAMAIHVSYMTARRWHVDFVRLVAENLGLT